MVNCSACGKLVTRTQAGNAWRHVPSVRFPDAVRADGKCTGTGRPPGARR